LEQVQTETAGANDVRFLSFRLDPRTDPPPALAQFARRWHADPQRWFLLTGEKPALHHLIETRFLTSDPAAADVLDALHELRTESPAAR
jgi:cytochrome oxidase Cu insertion factor (SCO1/SenC/PrrC family)